MICAGAAAAILDIDAVPNTRPCWSIGALLYLCQRSGVRDRIHGDADDLRGEGINSIQESAAGLIPLCPGCVFLRAPQFPYYNFTNKDYMYKVGSAMYGIYFIVTFPMYFRSVDYSAPPRCRATDSRVVLS